MSSSILRTIQYNSIHRLQWFLVALFHQREKQIHEAGKILQLQLQHPHTVLSLFSFRNCWEKRNANMLRTTRSDPYIVFNMSASKLNLLMQPILFLTHKYCHHFHFINIFCCDNYFFVTLFSLATYKIRNKTSGSLTSHTKVSPHKSIWYSKYHLMQYIYLFIYLFVCSYNFMLISSSHMYM